MTSIGESIEQTAHQIREKADQVINDAVQQAASAHQTLARQGAEQHLLDQIRAAQESVHAVAEKIASTRKHIAAERKPVQERLSEMQAAVTRAQAEVDNIGAQIKAKEQEIERLSQKTHQVQNVWPLGKIRIPDPQAVARAGALRVEVAGLHSAMAAAQQVLARAIHEKEALHLEALKTPIEADPRIMALFKELEAEKTAIATLSGQMTGTVRMHLQELFTTGNRHKLAAMAGKQIDTGLPDDVEEDLFFDAIAKIEQTVMEAIPAKALALMQDAEQGISGDTKAFESRLAEKINAQVDLPVLDEKQEGMLFAMLIHVLVEAMMPGKTLDTLLSES